MMEGSKSEEKQDNTNYYDFASDTTDTESETEVNHTFPNQTLPFIPDQLERMCKSLSQGERRQLSSNWRNSCQADDNIVGSGKTTVTRGDMKQRFDEQQLQTRVQTNPEDLYLTSDMIHAFLNQTASRGLESQHRVLCINPLYEVLKKSPVDAWRLLNRTKIRHIDFSSIDSILIPVNVGSGTHWSLTHINLRLNTIEVYDSIHRRRLRLDDPQHHIEAFLNEHPYLSTKPWRIVQTPNYPQQTNNYDCGAFTCAAALAIITREDMQFHQGHMPAFRSHLALHLIQDSTTRNHVQDLYIATHEGERRGGRGRDRTLVTNTH
jgi:hypothetical protein